MDERANKLSLVQRMAVKLNRMVFPGNGGTRFGGNTSGDYSGSLWGGSTSYNPEYNYEAAVGPLWSNSAVASCIAWMQRAFPEAILQVTQPTADGDPEPITDHALPALIDSPNPYYSGDLLWRATILSFMVDGNAYWIKARGNQGNGKPLELWYVPHWQMAPLYPQEGTEFLTGYLYKPGYPQKNVQLAPEDVVHFRYNLDPFNTRQGVSPLSTLFREVDADNQANTYTSAILRNMGVPSLGIGPKDGSVVIREDEANRIRAQYRERVTGENRGKILVTSSAMEYHEFGVTPEKMALDKIRQVPEDRICAALGIPAMVVGLTAGALSKTFANYAEAREAAMENNIIPTQDMMARELALQLLPDFGDPKQQDVGWDRSKVRALQPDEDAIHARFRESYKAGIITKDEARAGLGLAEVTDGTGDTFFSPPPALHSGQPGADGQKPPQELVANGNGRKP